MSDKAKDPIKLFSNQSLTDLEKEVSIWLNDGSDKFSIVKITHFSNNAMRVVIINYLEKRSEQEGS